MKKSKKPILIIPIFFLVLGLLESYKTKEYPIDTLAFVITLAILLGAMYLAEKYLELKKWLDKNPEHFDNPLWLAIPTVGSIAVTAEFCITLRSQSLSAGLMSLIIILFWENIVSAIDKWLPTQLEEPIKLALLPLLIAVIFLQGMGLLEKRYYQPYFKVKESN